MKLKLALLFLFAIGPTSFCSLAQVPQGQLLGTVTDPAGATVADAAVSLTNELTGVVYTASTTSSGDYVFPYLNPGSYSVTVTKEGFETAKFSGLSVRAGEKLRADAQLKVGQTTTTVQVSGQTATLDTDSAAVGSPLTTREVEELPLNGREYSALAVVEPTVLAVGITGQVGITAGASFATQLQIASGNTWFANGYLYDGVDNVFPLVSGAAINPSIDSIQEFRLERSTFAAEFGRGGNEVEVVTKTGTNQFHGAAWEYFRNGDLDAGDYYLHQRDNLKRNQFGGNLGGPIRKEKAFFFFNYEGQRLNNVAREQGSVFTPQMRAGDLSQFLPGTVTDPETGLPFPGNVIPTSRLDPVALSLMNTYMPLPNLPGISNNYLAAFKEIDNWNQYITRIDYNPTSNDRISGRFAGEPSSGLTPGLSAGSQPTILDTSFYNVAASWTHNWTSTLFSDVRFGFHHERILQNSVTLPKYADPNIDGVGNNVPIIVIDPFSVEMIAWNFPANWHMKSFDWVANVTEIKGKHTLKAGFELSNHDWTRPTGPGPEHVEEIFDGQYTGNGVGDYLLGIPATASTNNVFVPTGSNQYFGDLFVQDDWKVTPSLTLNLGLRYDLITRRREDRNLFSSFDPKLGKIVVAGSSINTALANPEILATYPDLYITPSQAGLPVNTLAYGQHTDFSPRLGFAWRPWKDNKTVVRGGYGIFYMGYWENLNGEGFGGTPYGYGGGAVANTTPPTLNIANPFAAGTGAVPVPSVDYYRPNIHDGYVQQFSLGVQRQLPWDMVGEVILQNQHGLYLASTINLNQPEATAGTTPLPIPYPQVNAFLLGIVDDGHNQYRDLELLLRKHAAHANFELSYVWAKNLARLSPENPYDPDEFYGPYAYVPTQLKLNYVVDLPVGKGQRFLNRGGIVNAVLGGWAFSGFFVLHQGGSPLTIITTLNPANIPIPPQAVLGDLAGERPDRTCGGRLGNQTVKEWFNTSCFAAPTPGTFGNSGTGIIFGPTYFSGDFSFFKNFAIHENVGLQFRAEMFNGFNHPNLGNPDTNFSSPTFGQVTSVNQTPRQIQLVLRLTF
jgi:Carboxypeptidase regulatory-like domain/TonB dependent receptor